jgi:hypothetical protein
MNQQNTTQADDVLAEPAAIDDNATPAARPCARSWPTR